MINLYVDSFWISPYAFSAFVALKEKGLAFETRTVNLAHKEQRAPEYQEPSLTGRVPAIEHDGFWLSESSAIIEYLEDAFASQRYPRVLPEDLRERARARQIMAWVRSDLMGLREERPTTTMFYQRAQKPLSAVGREAEAKLIRVASSLIADGATSLFERFSIADADLAFMLQRLILNGHDVPAKLRDFAHAQWARPSVLAWTERERIPYEGY
ncbi:MAG: glutathione transferase [Myxococcales bacterium]|nr:glutathione transferase [Myxococcales bacterium]